VARAKDSAGGTLGNFEITGPAPQQPYSKMHSRFVAENLDHVVKFFLNTPYQRASSLAIEDTHSSNMACKVPFIYKIRNHILVEIWRAKIHGTANGSKAVNKIQWNDNIRSAWEA
jgi:hypothetical protein